MLKNLQKLTTENWMLALIVLAVVWIATGVIFGTAEARIEAGGSILGGIIGAAGAAMGVLWSIRKHDEEEAIKASKTIIAEIGGKLVLIGIFIGLTDKIPDAMPIRSLKPMLSTQESVVYKTNSASLAYLTEPAHIVAFYEMYEKINTLLDIGNQEKPNVFIKDFPHALSSVKSWMQNVFSLGLNVLEANCSKKEYEEWLTVLEEFKSQRSGMS